VSLPNEKERTLAPILKGMGPEAFTQIFRQHRVGRFQVECRVFDEGRLLGIGHVDLEILFKGRFFDQDAFMATPFILSAKTAAGFFAASIRPGGNQPMKRQPSDSVV
jgi:hypothetical protein